MASSDRYGGLRGEFRRTPRCEVVFDGWRADTYQLEHCGWQIAVEDTPIHALDRVLRMMLNHPSSGITLYAECRQPRYLLEQHRMHEVEPTEFVVLKAAARQDRMVLVENSFNPAALRRVHALPRDDDEIFGSLTFRREQTTVSALGLFSPWQDPQAIVVDPETIDTLMTKIRTLQAPELARIREQNRKREQRVDRATERVHAQIITLAA
jgi:hypothetical protein